MEKSIWYIVIFRNTTDKSKKYVWCEKDDKGFIFRTEMGSLMVLRETIESAAGEYIRVNDKHLQFIGYLISDVSPYDYECENIQKFLKSL